MAQGFYGADPDQLRALAKQFSSGSNQIRSSLETVSSLVNSTQSWQGPDASAFQQRWNSQVKQLGNTVVHALELGSTTLIKNADEQTATSQVDGGPGGGGPGAPGGPGSGGPGSPGGSGANPWQSFRDGWGDYGMLKNFLGLPKNLYGLGAMASRGVDAFMDAKEWAKLASRSAPYNLMDSATDLLGLKNLNKYFPALNGAKGFFEDSKWLFQGKGEIMESLGKNGLGRGLGWLGVGLNGFDAVSSAMDGDVQGALASGGKAILGVACFLPPPAGTVAQVASAAIAIYEIPAVKEFVDNGVKAVGDTVSSAIKDPGKFVSDVGDNIKNAGEGVKDFFGW